jgi:hypothetical protein
MLRKLITTISLLLRILRILDLSRKPKYHKGEHFNEVGRKNFFHRYYLTKNKMEFQTYIHGKKAKIIRKSDGKVLAELKEDGTLIVYEGYYWDGPSGPTIDTIAFIIGSLPHDVLYQMLREGKLLDISEFQIFPIPIVTMYEEFRSIRKKADLTMKVINYDNGMTWFRSYYTHKFVRAFGEKHALPPILKNSAAI